MKKIILISALTAATMAIFPLIGGASLFSMQEKKDFFLKAEISFQNPIVFSTEKTIRSISPGDRMVELDDGTKLFVRPSDMAVLKTWQQGTQLHLQQNDLWGALFSSYQLLLVNSVTKQWVKANLPKPPFDPSHTPCTIQYILDGRGLIFLSDGTILTFSESASSWEIGDEILLGSNCKDHWLDSYRDVLLINATKKESIPASFCNLDVDSELLGQNH